MGCRDQQASDDRAAFLRKKEEAATEEYVRNVLIAIKDSSLEGGEAVYVRNAGSRYSRAANLRLEEELDLRLLKWSKLGALTPGGVNDYDYRIHWG